MNPSFATHRRAGSTGAPRTCSPRCWPSMFVAFIVQIVFRYLLNLPIGWTNELSVILWIWLVLFGAAFVVREDEEIRFDLIYGAVGPRPRRVMFVICGRRADRPLRASRCRRSSTTSPS